MQRKIPTTMATQHPDNAGVPYWHTKAFLTTSAELQECFLNFSDLEIDEYNWDWEGKFVDEAVVDRLLHKHPDYFRKHPLGKDKFLTFRIPNPRVEKQFRLARAFMVIVTSSQLIASLGYENPPVFETILPLTETVTEVIELQQAYRELVRIDHKLLKMNDSLPHIEIIPLFEQVDNIVSSPDFLRTYIREHKKHFRVPPAYVRPYCARSDPALNSGLLPTMIALKIALAGYRLLEQESGIRLYPMVGTGSLPFRGGVNPDTIESALIEYAGVRTLTVQSAFRYDYKVRDVKKSIEKIRTILPTNHAKPMDHTTEKRLKKSIQFFKLPYQETIEEIAPFINALSVHVPRRRERMQHIGLFGYSRGVGSVRLPRAIPFTASLYSIGVPPELIGTGRGIKRARKSGVYDDIKEYYVSLRDDLVRAGYFFNRDNLVRLSKTNDAYLSVLTDVEEIENALNVELGPKTTVHFEHKALSDTMLDSFLKKKNITSLISQAGILRKSLG